MAKENGEVARKGWWISHIFTIEQSMGQDRIVRFGKLRLNLTRLRQNESLYATHKSIQAVREYLRYGRKRTWHKIAWCLPDELPGSIQRKLKKCGKPNCKCSSGLPEDKHVTHYRVWYEGGRQKAVYVRKSELEAVQAKIEKRRQRLRKERRRRNVVMGRE